MKQTIDKTTVEVYLSPSLCTAKVRILEDAGHINIKIILATERLSLRT